MMKNIKYISVLLFILSGFIGYAQQDPMFTQYITNPVSVNPAITGINEYSTLSLICRKQWVGIDGAPTTLLLNYDGVPSYRNVGLGVSLIQDRIGPLVQTGLYFNYAYHLKIDEDKKLSLGLMGGANYYQFDLVSLIYNGPDDDIATDGLNSKLLPNFGFGAFYHTPKYYAGFSIPKLLRNSLFEANSTLTRENKEERHFFAWAGMLVDINENITFKPSLIGRVVNGAPASLDLNATFMLYDKIWIGALYRLGVTWGGLVRWQLNDNINLGYSYDLSNTRIKGFSSGSHEISISYIFAKDQKRLLSPRYF